MKCGTFPVDDLFVPPEGGMEVRMKTGINVGIAGGGMGGIFTGALLANRGYQVEIFDKNPVPGGYCQAFKRKGYSIHPAVLRIGSESCAKMVEGYCRQAGMDKLEWNRYTEYYQFSEDIKINQCTARMDLELIRYFPEEKENIEAFFSEIWELYHIMNKVFENSMTLKGLTGREIEKYIPNISKTAVQFVEEYFENNLLKNIILAMLELDDKSVALAIPMTYFEIKGQGEYYVPQGGAYHIILKCIQIIEANGGKVHRNAEVSGISAGNNKVTGMTVNGREYEFDLIVSGIDINKTYRHLIGEEYVANKKMLMQLKNKWKISKSCLSIWIGFDKTLEELGIDYGSVIFYPDKENVKEIRNIMKTEGESLPEGYWYQCFTAFSRDEMSTPAGKSQMCIGILVPYDFQNKWWAGEQYKEKKRLLVQRILKDVEKHYPKMKDSYVYVEAATPLTYERECGNTGGAYLGFEKYQNFVYDRARHQNQGLFDNLFFAGHWVSVIGGVNGVMQECIKTANLIMQKYPLCSGMQEYKLFEQQDGA